MGRQLVFHEWLQVGFAVILFLLTAKWWGNAVSVIIAVIPLLVVLVVVLMVVADDLVIFNGSNEYNEFVCNGPNDCTARTQWIKWTPNAFAFVRSNRYIVSQWVEFASRYQQCAMRLNSDQSTLWKSRRMAAISQCIPSAIELGLQLIHANSPEITNNEEKNGILS
jgi:hypothetical protein